MSANAVAYRCGCAKCPGHPEEPCEFGSESPHIVLCEACAVWASVRHTKGGLDLIESAFDNARRRAAGSLELERLGFPSINTSQLKARKPS